MLEHADRDDVVELAVDLAVVLQPELDPVGEPGGLGAGGRDPELLLAERDAGDPGAADAREIEREAAPAAADVEHAGAGADQQLRREQPLLGELGLGEADLRPLEPGAGILHVVVEEEAVEALVEVVVVRDVGARGLQPDRAQDRRVGDAAAKVLEPGAGGRDLGPRLRA